MDHSKNRIHEALGLTDEQFNSIIEVVNGIGKLSEPASRKIEMLIEKYPNTVELAFACMAYGGGCRMGYEHSKKEYDWKAFLK